MWGILKQVSICSVFGQAVMFRSKPQEGYQLWYSSRPLSNQISGRSPSNSSMFITNSANSYNTKGAVTKTGWLLVLVSRPLCLCWQYWHPLRLCQLGQSCQYSFKNKPRLWLSLSLCGKPRCGRHMKTDKGKWLVAVRRQHKPFFTLRWRGVECHHDALSDQNPRLFCLFFFRFIT